MFTDEAQTLLRAGNGGPGKVSFARPPMRGPDGGNGGKGGDVYIVVTDDLTALNRYTSQKEFEAENGFPGGSNKKTGRNGKDITVVMPIGTTITDIKTRESFELTDINQKVLICYGGKGGKGNWEFRSPSNTTPKFAQKGQKGEVRQLNLILRLLADFGLIGLPNAGKSSLLNELTAANVKTADYPFTTLEPNLGVFNKKIIADIPGLIEGASKGKGLGIKFLKHIEKVKVLLHCLSSESQNLNKDYKIVRDEMEKFNDELLAKKEIILLTKTDLIGPQKIKKIVEKLKKINENVMPVSIHNWDSLKHLKRIIAIA